MIQRLAAKFTPKTFLKCNKCNDVVHSAWEGQFVPCKCGAIFVDETKHYTRIGGESTEMEDVSDKYWVNEYHIIQAK